MTIENLIKAVPPPASPTYAFDGPWDSIEANLNTPLPRDIKDLARVYGCGTFLGFIGPLAPVCPVPWIQLIPAVYSVRNLLVEQTQCSMYPRPGGLLACGNVVDVGHLLWLTRGATPEEWPVVVWDHDPGQNEELTAFECDLTDFIAGVVTGDILFPGYDAPSDYLFGQPLFEPASDPSPGDALI